MVPGEMFYLIRGAFSTWQDVCDPMSQADNMNIFIVLFDKVPNFEDANFARIHIFSSQPTKPGVCNHA